MKIEIKNRWDNKILLCGEYESIKDCLEKNRDANLMGADLWSTNLVGANLGSANLVSANLGSANLVGADLWGANLMGADLWGANLMGANLGSANLVSANLGSANLVGADLRGANLMGADLVSVNLVGAKNYYMSHDICFELIKRQKLETFTSREWVIIGQIVIHRFCWDTIKKRYNKKIIPIFKKLSKVGFDEYEKYYKSKDKKL